MITAKTEGLKQPRLGYLQLQPHILPVSLTTFLFFFAFGVELIIASFSQGIGFGMKMDVTAGALVASTLDAVTLHCTVVHSVTSNSERFTAREVLLSVMVSL